MPTVGKGKAAKHFPYTPAGQRAAAKARKQQKAKGQRKAGKKK